MAAEAGQLELNAFEPVIFYTLFESIETLGHAAQTLTDNCILGITANEKHCKDLVNASAGIATALLPVYRICCLCRTRQRIPQDQCTSPYTRSYKRLCDRS